MWKALGIVVVLAVIACLLWIGGEMHYRNCVNTADARVPRTGDALLDEFDAAELARREDELKRGCSRVPW